MVLRSSTMQLTTREKSWLPWWGATGKWRLSWSCFLNRSRYEEVERTFEGIAETRKRILIQWVTFKWTILEKLTHKMSSDFTNDQAVRVVLHEALKTVEDFSELFVVDPSGRVLASTHEANVSKTLEHTKALEQGLEKPFLHGPYLDPVTTEIGPSSSKFHDEVTLMFYQPVVQESKVVGCLCGRIPNDVLSDLIQREGGHVYPESGDNYLFMVDSTFDPSIPQGIALSRSRFEDDSFTGGENLKGGVSTAYGVVSIKKHTEFEVLFTDPATGQLHPGVRETIRNGSNLYVTYPGYSDYRHIPVVGAGVTLQLPGSPDRWGMMCEGDLQEVYAVRSTCYRFMRFGLALFALLWTAIYALSSHGVLSSQGVAVASVCGGIGAFL
ncbi:MAG: cache domain-containing protein, partial [Gammaproteobacteria bacterium]